MIQIQEIINARKNVKKTRKEFLEKWEQFNQVKEDFHEKRNKFQKVKEDFNKKRDQFIQVQENVHEKGDQFKQVQENFKKNHDQFKREKEKANKKWKQYKQVKEDFYEKRDQFQQAKDELKKIVEQKNEKLFVELIKKSYNEILNKNPEKKVLDYYVTLMKFGELDKSELHSILERKKMCSISIQDKNDSSVSQMMKNDWNERASTNSMYFVHSELEESEKEFWKSGFITREQILGNKEEKSFSNIIGKNNPKNMKVLEIGCGIGRVMIPMSEIFETVYGVDISGEMIKQSKKYIKDIPGCKTFENNSSELSMFTENFFDFCYSIIVFQHIPSKEVIKNYVKEVSKVIKPSGVFKFQVLGGTRKPDIFTTWEGVNFTSHEIHKMAEENNFEILEEVGQNDQYYWLTFKSKKNNSSTNQIMS